MVIHSINSVHIRVCSPWLFTCLGQGGLVYVSLVIRGINSQPVDKGRNHSTLMACLHSSNVKSVNR